MKRKHVAYLCAVVAAAAALWFGLAQAQQKSVKAPSIEGTYLLESRDLPDGTTLKPPDIFGLSIYTKKYRNFNVGWKTPDGKTHSFSVAAEYSLSGDTYREGPIIFYLDNGVMDSSMSYTPPSVAQQSAKVTVKGDKITWTMPGEPPVVTVDANGLTAEAKGQFVDHWKKVE